MRLFQNEPYLSALAEVYDVSKNAILLADTGLRPIYFNAAAGTYYGQICEPDALKNGMTPQTIAKVREALKEKDVVRAEMNGKYGFSSVLYSKIYNRDGKVIALRVQAETEEDPTVRALIRHGTIDEMMRYEMIAPCADILRSAREMLKTEKADPTLLKHMEQDAFSCLRFVAKLADVVSSPGSELNRNINLTGFILRFAQEYNIDVSMMTGDDPIAVTADDERLCRTLCICLQELISLPSTGKYRTRPTIALTQDQDNAKITMRRTRVRESGTNDSALTDLSVKRLGGTVTRVAPGESGGLAVISVSLRKSIPLSPEFCLSDSRETEMAVLGGIYGDILTLLLYR